MKTLVKRLTGFIFIALILALVVPLVSACLRQSSLNKIEPMLAQEKVQGYPIITDGDTLKFSTGDKIVRIQGIDAPESQQNCLRKGVFYACGTDSTNALKSYIGNNEVVCESQGYDRYRRMIGVCAVYKNNIPHDLGAYMVEQGHAVAYRYYTKKYVPQEYTARQKKQGLWGGAFVTPYEWRKGKRLKP